MTARRYTVSIRYIPRVKVKVPEAHGVAVRYQDGPEEVREVIVEVDVEYLASVLGPRALASKGKKAVEAGGAIVVRPA
jgi:hypothetical protein